MSVPLPTKANPYPLHGRYSSDQRVRALAKLGIPVRAKPMGFGPAKMSLRVIPGGPSWPHSNDPTPRPNHWPPS